MQIVTRASKTCPRETGAYEMKWTFGETPTCDHKPIRSAWEEHFVEKQRVSEPNLKVHKWIQMLMVGKTIWQVVLTGLTMSLRM